MEQQIMPVPSVVTSKSMWEHEALEKTWKRVEERVQLFARKEKKEIRANMQIEDVMDCLKTAQETDRKSQDKHEWVRRQFDKTLKCIQTLSGVVSSAASTAFPPATICFNAISIVIQGYQNYRGIYEGLAKLFAKSIDFFDRLEEYRKGCIDEKLARITCQFLEVFIDICETSINLRSRYRKLLAFSSEFFLKDGVMQDHLKKMEDLIQKEQSLVSAQSLRLMHGVDGRGESIERLLREDISQRDGDRDNKTKDSVMKTWKQNLIKALGFPDDMLARNSNGAGVVSEPKAEWTRTMDQYTEKLTADTGKWIEDLPEFKAWTDDHEQPATPLLVVEGDTGTGKSCLMTHVHHHLQSTGNEAGGARRSVAYLFLDSNVQKGESKQDIFAYVSRCLLWQCAVSSESLVRSMSTIYEEKKVFNGPLDWWSALLLENKERERLGTTFYFLVDGLDAEIGEIAPLLRQLTKKYAKSRIRICLTTKNETTRTLRASWKLPLEVVKIQEHNQEDVKNYIISRMDQMPTLHDIDRSAVVEWRNKILETLTEKGGGDFFTLASNLDDISKMHLFEDINEVLESTSKTHVDSIDSQIQALNQDLTQKEIQEVNKIILWVAYGRTWLNLDEMDSVLSIHQGGADAISGFRAGSSLMSLSEKLKKRYNLFQMSPGSQWVKFRSDRFKTRITDLGKSVSTSSTRAGNVSGIHETEIRIIEHFLSQVCPADLYSKFRFTEFFNQKRSLKERDYIHQDSNNAELQIALTCLRIITEPRDDKTARLRSYALRYFLDHMKAVDLARADATLKAHMGPVLLQLFTETSVVTSTFCLSPKEGTDLGKHLSLDLPNFLARRKAWLWTPEGAQEVLKWLTDSSVLENVTNRAQLDLVKRFIRAPVSESRFVLLQAAATHTASLLLQTPEGLSGDDICFATIFLHGYVSNEKALRQIAIRKSLLKDITGESSVKFDEPRSLSVGDLQPIEDWASKALDIREKDSLWESQMARLTNIVCFHGENIRQQAVVQAVVQRTNRALELDNDNWLAWYYKTTFGVMDASEAIDTLKDVTERMQRAAKADPGWLDIKDRRPLLADLYFQLGNRLWSTGTDIDSATHFHLKCLKYPSHDQSYRNFAIVFRDYRKAKVWTHVMNFLAELARNNDWTLESVHSLANYLLRGYVFQKTVACAVKSTGRWDVVESFFARIIRRLEQDSNSPSDALFWVRCSYGRILSITGHDEDNLIHLWQKAIDDQQSGRNKHSSLTTDAMYNVVNKLAPIYAKRGQAPNSTPKSVLGYIMRLREMTKLSKEAWSNKTASCCLARLHLVIGQEQEAKHAVTELIRSALEMLSDDDPSNDFDAMFYLLASVFATMNDEVQTRAAWHLMSYVVGKPPKIATQQDVASEAIFPSEESTQEQVTDKALEEAHGNSVETSGSAHPATIEDETKQLGKKSQADSTGPEVDEVAKGYNLPGSTDVDAHSHRTENAPVLGRDNEEWVECDGCEERWNAEDELYTCSNCMGQVQFCGRCMDKLSKGELEEDVCDKNHRLIYIPKVSPVRAPTTENTVMVPVAGQYLTLEDWKLQVRSLYITTI